MSDHKTETLQHPGQTLSHAHLAGLATKAGNHTDAAHHHSLAAAEAATTAEAAAQAASSHALAAHHHAAAAAAHSAEATRVQHSA